MNIVSPLTVLIYHMTGHVKMARYKIQKNIILQIQNFKQILMSESPSPFPLPLKRGRGLRKGGWNNLRVLVFGVL